MTEWKPFVTAIAEREPAAPKTKTRAGEPALADVKVHTKIVLRATEKRVSLKGDELPHVKTLYVAPNKRSQLLKFAADDGPDKDLVIGCADGWELISAE